MSRDSFSASEIASFIDSDEISSIDGIKLTKSKSYTHLNRDKEQEMRRTLSYTGAALLRPEVAINVRKNRARSRERSEDDDDSSSSKREKHKPMQDLLALPIRDPSLVKKLLSKKATKKDVSVSVSEESSYEVSKSEGGTVHKRRKRKSMSQRKNRQSQSKGSQDSKTDDKSENSESKESKGSKTDLKESKADLKADLKGSKDSKTKADYKKDKAAQDPHTKEEIEALTNGFFLVPRFDWYTLEPGSCIKWVNKYGKCTKNEWYCWYQKVSKVTGGNFFYVGQFPNKSDNYAQIKMAVFWDNIKYLYKKEDPGTKLLRQAIDKRQDYINDLAIFLRNKYGEEFEKYMNKRGEVRRQKHSEQQAVEKARLAERQKQDALKLEKMLAADEKRAAAAKPPLNKQRSAKLKKVASEKKITSKGSSKTTSKGGSKTTREKKGVSKPVIKTGVKKIVNSFAKKPSD